MHSLSCSELFRTFLSLNFIAAVISTFGEFSCASHCEILYSVRCPVDNRIGFRTFSKNTYEEKECDVNYVVTNCRVQVWIVWCSVIACYFLVYSRIRSIVSTTLYTHNCLPNWLLQSACWPPDTLSCLKCTSHEYKTNIHRCCYNCLNWDNKHLETVLLRAIYKILSYLWAR
jgi:hypothetical protein